MRNTKRILLGILLLLVSSNFLNAQTNSEAETLFDGEKITLSDLGFFVAPAMNLSTMDGGSANLFHLRGGINFQDKISFGGFYNVSINRITPESETIADIYMDYWTAGGFTEFTFYSNKLIHFSVPLYFGYGEIQMDSEINDPDLDEAIFFKMEPSALIELNLHKYVRLNIGIGYRMVGDVNYRNIDQSDLSGFTTYFGLKFGLFR